jgi:hypothetical protein
MNSTLISTHDQCTEAHDGPRDTPWTAEENESFAKHRAETVAAAEARAAKRSEAAKKAAITRAAIRAEDQRRLRAAQDAHREELRAIAAQGAAKQAEAAKPKPPTSYILANDHTTVEFRPIAETNLVLVIRKSQKGRPENVGPWSIARMPLHDARDLYMELQRDGYWKW